MRTKPRRAVSGGVLSPPRARPRPSPSTSRDHPPRRQTVLSEELLLDVIHHVRTLLAERTTKTTTDLPRMEKEATRLRTEIDRLVTALATIDQKPEAVIRAIAERQEELSALEARLRGAKAAPEAIHLELRRMEAEARTRLDELKGILTRKPEQAREVISMLFEGPIKLTPIETPEGKRFWVEGSANLWALFAAGCLKSASPGGHAQLGRGNLRGWGRSTRRRGSWRSGWWDEAQLGRAA